MSLDFKLKKRVQYSLLLIFSPIVFQACQNVNQTEIIPSASPSSTTTIINSPSISSSATSPPDLTIPTPSSSSLLMPMCSPEAPKYEDYMVSIDNKLFRKTDNDEKIIDSVNYIDDKNIIYNKSYVNLISFNSETQERKEILKGFSSFSISPDKKQIAYIQYDNNSKYNLFISDIKGLNSKKINSIPLDFPASYIHWSPDSKKITVDQQSLDRKEIFIFDISGKNYIISQASASIKNLWSPDSKKFAFINDQQSRQIAYYDIETNQQKNISNDSVPKANLSWSANSDKLFYYPVVNDKNSIFITNLDGTNQRMVADSLTSGEFYTSDDNKFIAYSSIENSKTLLYMLDTNTLSIKVLTDLNNKMLSNVKWFANNQNIVYSIFNPYDSEMYQSRNNIDLYTVKSDGTNNQRLTNSPTSESFYYLSPDNKTIYFISNISLYLSDGCKANHVENWDYITK